MKPAHWAILGCVVIAVGAVKFSIPGTSVPDTLEESARNASTTGRAEDAMESAGDVKAQPSKSFDRQGSESLVKSLPPGVELRAERIGHMSADGNVRVTFPHGVELNSSRVIRSASGDGFTAEGDIKVWSDDRKSLMSTKDGTVKLTFGEDGETLKMNASQGMTIQAFNETQPE